MKKFDQQLVKTVRQEVEEAISKIADKYGLKASTLGNIGYDDRTMHTAKLSFAIADSQSPLEGVLAIDLLGKRFKHGSRVFTITRVEGTKFAARTNRGATYLVTREQLSTMIQL